MTHFLKNVLTFLFQYDIYQLLLKVSKRAEVALCFERASLERREQCTMSSMNARSPLTAARPRRVDGY